MAGFYIHIPFCSRVCYYCDFHFVASLKSKETVVAAIKKEIADRSKEWKNETFQTIYFGGGTPSILSVDEIISIIKIIDNNYTIEGLEEFTLEANPDDLTFEYLKKLKEETGISRLSIGIQSFDDKILKFLNRRHTGIQAVDSVKNALKAGFENITIDIIYGIPGLDNITFEKDLNTFLSLEIPHLSAYHLSIEPKTVFGVMQKRNQLKAVDENLSTQQYTFLTETLTKKHFEHYEISNFAKSGMYSKHNTAYWKNIPYVGIGPSAHSFDGDKRRWNIANNTAYSRSLSNSSQEYYQEEKLTPDEKYNDYILTSLRTMWGANLDYINKTFGDKYLNYCLSILSKKEIVKDLIVKNQNFRINESSWLIADYLMSEFFMV
jgi:oxygen-independent coproporphyrinogen-3 oxidase